MFLFLLTHLLRGATPPSFLLRSPYCDFYSRTSCEVQLQPLLSLMASKYDFYSRTSCEVQQFIFRLLSVLSEFLLTHLLRGATVMTVSICYLVKLISTHAPLARCNGILFIFLPNSCISTHAPLARCNFLFRFGKGGLNHFYSRTSCEVQHPNAGDIMDAIQFLLTRLLRGATAEKGFKYSSYSFLLTHLLRGATINSQT